MKKDKKKEKFLGINIFDNIKKVFFYILKIFIFGTLFYTSMKLSKIFDNDDLKSYIKYFFIGTIILYLVSFLYFMYRCKVENNVQFSDMNYQKYAIADTCGIVVIVIHIMFLLIAKFLKVTPAIGIVLNLFATRLMLIIISTGIVYMIISQIAYNLIKCKKE